VSFAANLALGVGAAVVMGGATLVGYVAPGEPADASLAVTRHALPPADAAALRAPNQDMAAAVTDLAAAIPEPASERPEPAVVVVRRPVQPPRPPGPAVPAAPPMHDAGMTFRAETAAVVRLKDQSLAVLLSAPGGRSRMLHVGELFDERWRLVRLSMDEAVLGDGVTQERVPLYGNPAAGAAAGGAPQL
jgi:hypothetical protein